jgi:TPR repeat protein
VTKNLDDAVRWFRSAADWGDSRGQFNLGVSYATGQGGLARDNVQAHIWFSLAASRGNANGKDAVPRLEKLMSPEQVAEATRLREQWKPKQRIRPKGNPDWLWFAGSPGPGEP